MQPVCLGLVGLGEWPRQAYIPVIKDLEGVEVVAVAARSNATQQYAREQFGEITIHPDYPDLLCDTEVDAVLLAVPNAIHERALAAAIASGKHVFYEPPIAHSTVAVEEMLAAMDRAERVIQPDFELRWLPVVPALSARLQSGLIGDPLMATVRLWCNWGYGGGQWKNDPQGEGFFPWLGCWYLDLLDVVFAVAPESAAVTGGHAANGRLMDHGWASLEYGPERIGRFDFNLVAPAGLEVTLEVTGSRGEAHADLVEGRLRCRGGDGAWRESFHPAAQPACGFVGMRECLGGFIDSVRSGRSAEPHVEIARHVHAAMLLCAQAEATGEVIESRE